MIKTRDASIGKWRGILQHFGLSDSALSGKHGPCPGCRGKDRFRFADQNGSGNYYCSGCGPGSGFDLIALHTGQDFSVIAAEVDKIVGNIQQGKIVTTDYDKNLARLKKISNELKPIDDNIRAYLKSRGLSPCKNIRLHPSLAYFDEDRNLVGNFPAMVARVSAQDGSLITYHVTYLQDGKKAPVDQVKKFMPSAQPLSGGAIRLTGEYEHIGVTEGIESALACMKRFDLPVWAIGSSALIKGFNPPESIKSVIVFSDHDTNYAGQAASYALANRLVVQNKIDADVVIPKFPGDFADKVNCE